MVTIGRGLLDTAVHEFFEGMRSYDVPRAVKTLASDVDWESSWTHGKVTGLSKVEAFLKGWLMDPKTRPSLSIIDVAGDGAITRLKVSVSGRFGTAPEHVTFNILCLQHVIHHIKVVPDGKPTGGH